MIKEEVLEPLPEYCWEFSKDLPLEELFLPESQNLSCNYPYSFCDPLDLVDPAAPVPQPLPMHFIKEPLPIELTAI